MENQAYRLLKAAPTKIGVFVGGIAALAATIWTDAIRAFLGISWTNGQLTTWMAYFLAVACLYCALGWWLKPSTIESPTLDKAAIGSTTSVLQSHIDAMKSADNVVIGDEPPTPDLKLNGLLSQVYSVAGGTPQGTDQERNAFYKQLDREIADKIHLRGMAIWGRIGDRPLQRIVRTQSIVLDHKKKQLLLTGDTPYPTRYTDLHFNRAQVKEAWPLK